MPRPTGLPLPDAFSRTFRFSGRISRAGYWRWQLALAIIGSVLWVGMIAFAMNGVPWAAFGLLGVLAGFIYASVGVAVRRLHDRGKSGWWLILFQGLPMLVGATQLAIESEFGQQALLQTAIVFLALALVSLGVSAWGLIEIGFLRGQPGDNRYGPVVRI